MLKTREIKVNIYRDESQQNLFRSSGKIRRPKSVQHRLCQTSSSSRLSVVVVPIKVEWKQEKEDEIKVVLRRDSCHIKAFEDFEDEDEKVVENEEEEEEV